MYWKEEIKKIIPPSPAATRKAKARRFLKTDAKNVIRELEEFTTGYFQGLEEMRETKEMEDLSEALGKVSALLQKWL